MPGPVWTVPAAINTEYTLLVEWLRDWPRGMRLEYYLTIDGLLVTHALKPPLCNAGVIVHRPRQELAGWYESVGCARPFVFTDPVQALASQYGRPEDIGTIRLEVYGEIVRTEAFASAGGPVGTGFGERSDPSGAFETTFCRGQWIDQVKVHYTTAEQLDASLRGKVPAATEPSGPFARLAPAPTVPPANGRHAK